MNACVQKSKHDEEVGNNAAYRMLIICLKGNERNEYFC